MKIENINWTQNWSAKLCFLLGSFVAYNYLEPSKNLLGVDIKEFMIIHKNGISTGYLGKSEVKKFGNYLIKRVLKDQNLLNEWANRLKENYIEINRSVKNPVVNFANIDGFKIIEKAFSSYQSYHVAIKIVSNFLDEQMKEQYYGILEEARTYSQDAFDILEDFFDRLAELISRKENCQKTIIMSMMREEFLEYLKTGDIPEKTLLEQRHNLSAIFFNNHVVGEEVLIIEKSLSKAYDPNKLKGSVAYEGKIEGRCRIVYDPSEICDFHEGEILIAPMTHPYFMPLIHKAAAIVTDAGGILSHAAIIARELKKPCIIGTEVATKVLKDKDYIEVDAFNGIVKRIKAS